MTGNQGQDNGHQRGKVTTPVLQWVEAQRRRMQDEAQQQQQLQLQRLQQIQQMQHQLLQQQQPDLPLESDSFAPDVENFENLGTYGAQRYTTAIPGAAAPGTGQLRRGTPTIYPLPGALNYDYHARPPQSVPPYGPPQPPHPYPFMNHGVGVPAMTPFGHQVNYRPNFDAPAANHGAGQGAGALRTPAQVTQAQGSRRPYNVAPRSVAPRNEARNAPARAQQAGGEQPSTGQPPSGQPSTGASDHQLTISERLDRGLITDVAGLTRAEENEVLLWARGQGMKWNDIHEKFKFKVALSTLRGRYRELIHNGKPPKIPRFNETDEQLLLEAVLRIAGRHLDDPGDSNVKALWNKVKNYIKENGGQTSAGPGTLKLKYIELWRGKAAAKAWKETQKQKKGKTKGGPQDLEWEHDEYAQYPVEWVEGADFGPEEEEEDHSEYDDEMEEDADSN